MTDERTTVPAKCLQCEADLVSPIVCDGCRTLYPIPQRADYFDLLGIERRYEFDEAKLTAAFRAITRNIHPDRFNAQPEQVCTLSTRLSAEINQAYGVLKDPVRRADYMLEQAGGPSAAGLRDVPGDLLAEVMMLREEIDEARASGDGETVERLRFALAGRRAETLQRIAVRADGLSTSTDEEKAQFRKLLNSIRYFDNLLTELVADPLALASEDSNE